MSITSQPTKSERRWYRFSLRTLLIVMFLSTPGLGWISVRIKRAQANRDRVAPREEQMWTAAREMRKAGGYVDYSIDAERFPSCLELLFDDPGGADDPVQRSTVHRVTFDPYANKNQTDADLEHVRAFTDIEFLEIGGSDITDAGLVHLKGLTNLKRLRLHGTSVTDAGLMHLKEFTQLDELWLDGAHVTDAGLVHLEGFTNLKELNLDGTDVTYFEGVKNLQESLPNCKIREPSEE